MSSTPSESPSAELTGTSTPTLLTLEIQKDALNKGSYVSDTGPNYIVLGVAATILLALLIVSLSLYKRRKSGGSHRREILLSRRRSSRHNYNVEEDESINTLSQNESVLSSVVEDKTANSLSQKDSAESSQPDQYSLEDGITSPNLHPPLSNLTSNEKSEDEMSKHFHLANESTRLGDYVFGVAAKEISPYYSFGKFLGKSSTFGNDLVLGKSSSLGNDDNIIMRDSKEEDANAQADAGIEVTTNNDNKTEIAIP